MATAHRMSHADAAWLHMDQPTNLMVITGVLWFDEPPDWEGVRERIRERMVEPFPRFRQRVVEGTGPLSGPHWEDDPNFDPDLHFHRVALPAPGDPAALQDFVADLMANPLDRSKPLWHFHFVDGYGDGAAMVARIHHCIADGIALGRVLLSLTDESPDAGIAPADDSAAREESGGPLRALLRPAAKAVSLARDAAEALAHEAIEVGKDPSHLRDLAADAREDAAAVAKVLTMPADPPTALKGELGVAQRVAWSSPIPLDEVKAIGHASGTTVNDVLLTAVAGALRSYLEGRGTQVGELTAVVPFNLRPLDQPLPPELGNRFGLVYLPLPVGIEDRRARLDQVHGRMEQIKHSPEGAVSYGVLDAIGRTPVQIEKRLVDLFSTKGSAVMTNVPGPRQPVYMAGTPVRGVLVWAPCSGGVSMSVAIFSYAGEVTLGVMTDAGLVPDPERIIEAFEPELSALASEVS
ncbi:MAG TPA: wax ester/triacylglycerol synthase family O-acyltransferase [Solirubrobacterales bacterium]|nr:wax ester/triacylglycerol synthase family O-acyltransferase [Solirubrobacterales bacterium]